MSVLHYAVIEPYSTQQIFALVNDIETYPQFIPDCMQSGIVARNNSNELIAFIEVAKLGFRKRFITKNKFYVDNSIDIELVEGPFSYLSGRWQFIALDESRCKVIFDLQFQFKNKLLECAFAPLFRDIMRNMVLAFSRRAREIYSHAD